MDYRRMLMEDFSLSPEIVLHCRSEIEGHCSGLHRKGRTLHCLMRISRGDIDANCQMAVRWHGGKDPGVSGNGGKVFDYRTSGPGAGVALVLSWTE